MRLFSLAAYAAPLRGRFYNSMPLLKVFWSSQNLFLKKGSERSARRRLAYYYLFGIAEFLTGILLKKAKKLLIFSLRCDIMSKLSETAPNTTLEKSRSWSSARDWKSRNRQKRFESSNLSFSAKNPECISIRDFYFLLLHFSLFTCPSG